MKFVDVKNEVAFRKVFGNEKKKNILISFLNAVLGLDAQNAVKEVVLLNPFRISPVENEKSSKLDAMATDAKGVTFLLEMQVVDAEGFDRQALYAASKNYTGQVKISEIGDDSPRLLPVVFIGIMDFTFFNGKNFISSHVMVNEETGENVFRDIKLRFVELRKFAKKSNELKTLLDKWVYFLRNAADLDAIPSDVDDEGLKNAYHEVDQENWSKNEFDAYLYANAKRQDTKSRMDKVMAEMVMGMVAEGLTVAKIAKITRLTDASVNQIIADSKK